MGLGFPVPSCVSAQRTYLLAAEQPWPLLEPELSHRETECRPAFLRATMSLGFEKYRSNAETLKSNT